MRTLGKVGLVAGGYAGAALVATAIVAVHVVLTSGPDQQASSGMYAFGDSLIWLAVFAVAAVPATSAALWFLRSSRRFWPALSVVALILAVTVLAAFTIALAAQGVDAGSGLQSWSIIAVLRLLLAPLCALGLFLSALFTPSRAVRIALSVATLIEAAAFCSWIALIWLQPFAPR